MELIVTLDIFIFVSLVIASAKVVQKYSAKTRTLEAHLHDIHEACVGYPSTNEDLYDEGATKNLCEYIVILKSEVPKN